MSLRYFSCRVYKNSRCIVKYLYRRQYGTAAVDGNKCLPSRNANSKAGARRAAYPVRNDFRSAAARYSLQAKRAFIDNVVKKSNPLVAELRRRAARRFLSGDSIPFFALVGVSLSTGTGVLCKEDELEGLCLDIRDAVSKLKWNGTPFDKYENLLENNEVALKDLSFYQKPLAKGCSGIVYAAKIQPNAWEKFGVSDKADFIAEKKSKDLNSMAEFPLALKMMFNYDIESNALSILNAMFNETIPARKYNSSSYESFWAKTCLENRAFLPPHPNIVAMYGVFVDYVDRICNLSDSVKIIPAVQPRRLYEKGYGRNKSLFLLMKRYNYSLKDYLRKFKNGSRTSVLLLAQLLEGIAHMNLHGIAHRDLKSDNILVDTLQAERGDTIPIAVITDFGCCLADKENGLQLNYSSNHVDIGGNAALMAPEIINQTPGSFSVLNYAKSDLWAIGTIAYEVFGKANPFCGPSPGRKGESRLKNADYKEEDLPDLGEKAPALIKKLVRNILSRNPAKRLSAEVAANICQLYLWAPSTWLNSKKMPTSKDILQWLLCLMTRVLYERRIAGVGISAQKKIVKNTYSEYLLISSFLSRASLSQIKQAIIWMQANN